MVGNAVPVNFAYAFAKKIIYDLQENKKIIKAGETKVNKVREIIKSKKSTIIIFKTKRELEKELVDTGSLLIGK